MIRVLGLDPGIRNTGWALLEGDRVVRSGVIVTPKHFTLVQKRTFLRLTLRELVQNLQVVGVCGVETQVRWVGLAVAWATCCEVAQWGTGELWHVSARRAKASLGIPPRAGKDAVYVATRRLFPPGKDMHSQHEADAAAVAYAASMETSP